MYLIYSEDVSNPSLLRRIYDYSNMTALRINLWSGPRNVSTALMYSFAQRDDTCVVDEPLYGHYLTVTDADTTHPGAQAVLQSMNCDGAQVVRDVILGPTAKPVVFFKQMAHHLVALDRSFLRQTQNVILTRDPRFMIPSFTKNVPDATLRDTGYAVQTELLTLLREWGQDPPVLDARLLLLNPEGVLRKLCQRLGIAFQEQMLHWPAGARPEDGVWAEYWYHNVHRSTGFAPYREREEPVPERWQPLLQECLPYYEELEQAAIRA